MPADFSSEDLARIAGLARIALTDEEQTLFARQLSDVLAYARQIQTVDTSDAPPMSHPTIASSPLREDVMRPSLSRGDTLSQAPDADAAAGLFKVPRVLGS